MRSQALVQSARRAQMLNWPKAAIAGGQEKGMVRNRESIMQSAVLTRPRTARERSVVLAYGYYMARTVCTEDERKGQFSTGSKCPRARTLGVVMDTISMTHCCKLLRHSASLMSPSPGSPRTFGILP